MHNLLPQDIETLLGQLNSSTNQPWIITDDCLQKTFAFRDFKLAFHFMQQVSVEAEKLDHHPDWCNSYNRVSIKLTTHSAGGITELDFRLAEKIEQITATTSNR